MSGTRKRAIYRAVALCHPCLSLTVVALVGQGGQVASLSSSAKQAALYPDALWSSEQQRKTGSWVIIWFSNETLRFRRLSALPKGMQLINGEARIKARSPESQSRLESRVSRPMQGSWRCMGCPSSFWMILSPFSICHLYFWPWFPYRRTLVSASEPLAQVTQSRRTQ